MTNDPILQNLRRIEGQVKGVQGMIAEQRQCDDVLTQIMATCFEAYPPEEFKARLAKTIGIICKM